MIFIIVYLHANLKNWSKIFWRLEKTYILKYLDGAEMGESIFDIAKTRQKLLFR